MKPVPRRRVLLLAAALPTAALAHADRTDERLPTLGPAPTFRLDVATGGKVALADLRGRACVVTFIYTSCSDACPIVTAKLAEIGRQLGADVGPRVGFVAITVDPLNDTPERLREYARKLGADGPGWHFATGSPAQIDDVLRRYGAFARRGGDTVKVEHLFLTSLIDPRGQLRVQYLGYRFDAREMLADVKALLAERA